jgi:hypothetical protein
LSGNDASVLLFGAIPTVDSLFFIAFYQKKPSNFSDHYVPRPNHTRRSHTVLPWHKFDKIVGFFGEDFCRMAIGACQSNALQRFKFCSFIAVTIKC